MAWRYLCLDGSSGHARSLTEITTSCYGQPENAATMNLLWGRQNYHTCIIFIDTEDLYTVAFQNIVSQFGKDYTFDLKLKLMGLQTLETAKMIISALELPMTTEQFIEESKKQFEMLFPDTQLMPGKSINCKRYNKSFVCCHLTQ